MNKLERLEELKEFNECPYCYSESYHREVVVTGFTVFHYNFNGKDYDNSASLDDINCVEKCVVCCDGCGSEFYYPKETAIANGDE